MSDDEELQFAIELSKKSYAEEVARSGPDDLIRFESPDEPRRREKIDQIKKLFQSSQNSSTSRQQVLPYGFRISLDDNHPINSIPHSPSFPLNQFTTYQFTEPPPPPIPPKPAELRGYNFPPSPSISLLRDPPPLPPRSNRRSLPLSSSTPLRHSAPIFDLERASDLSPINLSLNSTFTDTSTTATSSEHETMNQYQPLTHLYVPYTMTNLNSSYNALRNGDLIDLEVDGTNNATQDIIRREFDPLYGLSVFNPNFSVTQYSIARDVDSEREDNSEEDQSSEISGEILKPEFFEFTFSNIKLLEAESLIEEQTRRICKRGLIFKEKRPFNFIAPTVDYMTTTASTIKVIVHWDTRFQMFGNTGKAMIANIEQTIELIVANSMSLFEINNTDDKQYGLKIYGLNQFLDLDSELGANLYTGHCLLHGEDVKLELAVFEEGPTSYGDNFQSWERMKSQLRYSSVMDKEDIENTLNHLEREMTLYEKSFNEGSTLKLSQTSQRVKQVVMLICKILHCIVPENMYIQMQSYLAATTEDQLRYRRSEFLREIHSFLESFCRSTASKYMLPTICPFEKPREEVLKRSEYLQIMLSSVQSVPEKWMKNYSEFYMSVDIYYGTQVLDGHSSRIPKNVKSGQFFPRIHLDLIAKFTRLTLCTYPRETRIVVSISGTLKSGLQAEGNQETEMLAYCSVPLYDEKLIMRQGPLFLPLTILQKHPLLKPFGPYPFIKDARDPILIMSLKVWDTEIFFPKVIVDLQCVPQDFSSLDIETQELLMELIEKQDPSRLEEDDQDVIWQKRFYLTNQPEALPLVLSSLSDWSFGFLIKVYQLLEEWAPLRPEIAMQLLLPQYPDEKIRSYAVQCIASGSTDFLYHSIPQFVEALRFELYEKSALADFILELASVSLDSTFEIYWQLQQRVDHCAVDDLPYAIRCQNLQQKIIDEHENPDLRSDIKLQHDLLNQLDAIQTELRSRPNDSEQERLHRLRTMLGILDAKLLERKVRLPICPSFDCTGVRVEECNIYNSNAKPLKIIFRGLSSNYAIIHKRDDDMRQDAFVMKMVNEMDRIWKTNGLDLRLITFRIMPVGFKRGMGELVLNCATFLEIQKEEGLTGVLKDEVLQKWLMKHNNSEFTFKEALDNFIRSCAGWCIVTYVLGIGDRHNDNILFTKNGHVFHIDFGKYMGDWQMAGGFRRDRVPFVFTSEMFYVINGSKSQTQNYQVFIDYCCKAFNFLRKNKNTLTNLLRIMACSDIAGINIESIAFVEKNLMLDLTETDATVQFTELIQNSLKSTFVRLNFVAHTFAQFMSSSSSFSKRDDNKLSFVPELYTQFSDGTIKHVRVLSFEKRFIPNKVYLYKIEVERTNIAVSSYVYRSFAEFDELHTKLRKRFPFLPICLNTRTNMRSNVRAIAQKRMIDVQQFLRILFQQVEDICKCDLVYTFFHSLLRDNKCDNYTDTSMMVPSNNCQIYLKVQHNSVKQTLSVFIGHVKNLAILQTGQIPDPYVKTYVRPDLQNYSKRKTQVVRGTQHPVFNHELSYEQFPQNVLPSRVLEVSVWNNGGLMDNHKMYMVCIPLMKVNNIPENTKANRVLEGWFQCDKYI